MSQGVLAPCADNQQLFNQVKQTMKTLILGVGNPILKDDGVGIHVLRELKKKISGVDFKQASVSGIELVEMLAGYERVIIIDAMKTNDAKPGEIYELTPDEIPTLHGTTPHDIDFRTALSFGEKFLGAMPCEIRIYGIEADNVTEFGEELTPMVAQSIPAVIEKIKKDLENGSMEGNTC